MKESTNKPSQMISDPKKDPIIDQIVDTIDKLAVFIQKDGGDIRFEGWDPETGTVYVSLTGACQGCMYIDQTLSYGVEAILQEEVKGVNKVRIIETPPDQQDPGAGF